MCTARLGGPWRPRTSHFYNFVISRTYFHGSVQDVTCRDGLFSFSTIPWRLAPAVAVSAVRSRVGRGLARRVCAPRATQPRTRWRTSGYWGYHK